MHILNVYVWNCPNCLPCFRSLVYTAKNTPQNELKASSCLFPDRIGQQRVVVVVVVLLLCSWPLQCSLVVMWAKCLPFPQLVQWAEEGSDIARGSLLTTAFGEALGKKIMMIIVHDFCGCILHFRQATKQCTRLGFLPLLIQDLLQFGIFCHHQGRRSGPEANGGKVLNQFNMLARSIEATFSLTVQPFRFQSGIGFKKTYTWGS